MTPGSAPVPGKILFPTSCRNKKEGYCAHFASATTLLLRSYGIPARYVEGYAVSVSDVSEGSTLQNETTSDWFTGKNPIGDTGVVSVNVTDADAHAWVEVYQKGIGWVPYEFTPASSGSEVDDSSTLLLRLLVTFCRHFLTGPRNNRDAAERADNRRLP